MRVGIIAIDGVAASGKGTLAAALSTYYKCDFLPTGNLYRLVAKKLLENGLDYNNPEHIRDMVRLISEKDLIDSSLKSDELSELSSKISSLGYVREELNKFQRQWIKDHEFAIVEGRDIGTIICPEAQVKIFLTADLAARALRRANDLGRPDDAEAILDDLRKRDARDSQRDVAPLKKAEDAELIDSTELSIQEMVRRAIGIIEKKIGI